MLVTIPYIINSFSDIINQNILTFIHLSNAAYGCVEIMIINFFGALSGIYLSSTNSEKHFSLLPTPRAR
jgi:hypothetical protein